MQSGADNWLKRSRSATYFNVICHKELGSCASNHPYNPYCRQGPADEIDAITYKPLSFHPIWRRSRTVLNSTLSITAPLFVLAAYSFEFLTGDQINRCSANDDGGSLKMHCIKYFFKIFTELNVVKRDSHY